jgi:hypothetical protein
LHRFFRSHSFRGEFFHDRESGAERLHAAPTFSRDPMILVCCRYLNGAAWAQEFPASFHQIPL